MKKLAYLLTTLIAVTFCLTGCLVPGGTNATPEGTIYAPGSTLHLIVEQDSEHFNESEIWNKMILESNVTPIIAADDGQTYANEIIIGNTSHPLSQKALAYLNGRNLSEDTAAFLLYVEGCSLALVYKDDFSAPFALEYFYKNCLGNTTYAPGADYKHIESFSISEYKENQWVNRWDVYNDLISGDAINAMKALYGLFDEDTYMWIAGLYDPEIGGFYFSESARDHVGFLPDVESTRQVLTFMERMGMTADFGGDLSAAVPKEISEKMVAFVKGLQDPDGYFYHVQWGKNIQTSRRGRDLTWSKYILKEFGATANYRLPDAPDVDVDDMSAYADTPLTAPLGSGVHAAVSKATTHVVATAYTEVDLSSPSAFIAWMNSLDFEHNSHADGQNFSSQASVIKAKGYADLALENLYSRACPETGLWEDSVTWGSIGGLLKLSSAISTLGGFIPYPEAAIRSCMQALLSDEEQSSMTCVYNCVNGASNVMNSMRREGMGDRVKEIQKELRADAEILIRTCTQKILGYKNDDGGFGYHENKGATHSQGALVALGVDESDLNGTLLATGSITGLVSIMGLPTVRVYGTEDYNKFVNELLAAGEVVKNNPEPPEPYGFDDLTPDTSDLYIQFEKSKTTGGALSVVADPRVGADGNVLKLESVGQKGGDYVAVKIDRVSSAAATCYVLEADILYDVTANCNAEPVQIYLRAAENSNKSIYMLSIRQENGILHFYDSSFGDSDGFKTDLGITIPDDEWFKLRIEYYSNVDENGKPQPRIKVIVTDSEGNKQERISTNYFGPRLAYAENQPSAYTDYLFAHFYAVNAADMSLYLDNIYVDRIEQAYSEEGYEGIVGGGDSDSFFEALATGNATTANDGSVLDFESFDTSASLVGWSKNTNFTVTAFSGTGVERFEVAEDEDGDKHLALTKTQKGAAILVFKAAEPTRDANCRVFEAEIYWDYTNLSSGLQIGLSNCNGYTMGSEFCSVLTTIYNRASYFGSTIKDTEVGDAGIEKYPDEVKHAFTSGSTFTVRIEHYTDVGRAKLYVNGVLAMDTDKVGDEDFTHVVLYTTSGFNGTIRIDDVTAATIEKDYDGDEENGESFLPND